MSDQNPTLDASDELSSPRQRVEWVDFAKGVGIVLVVIGHMNVGLHDAGMISENLFSSIHEPLYLFHMPLFFALSGYFFVASSKKNQAPTFIKNRTIDLIYPAIIWSWILFTAIALQGEAVNTPAQWSNFPLIPIPPISLYWFLWALFLIQLTSFFVLKLFQKFKYAIAYLTVVAFLGWLSFFYLKSTADFPRLNKLVLPALEHFPYFVVGCAFQRLKFRPNFLVSTVSALVFVLTLASFPWTFGERGPDQVAGLLATISALILFSGADSWIKNFRVNKLISFIGMNSLVIYLMHVFFGSGARVIFVRLGFPDPLVIAVFGTLLGIVAPLAAGIILKKIRIERFLGVRMYGVH